MLFAPFFFQDIKQNIDVINEQKYMNIISYDIKKRG